MRQKSTTIGFVLAMALASGMAGAQTTPTAPAGEKTPIADNTTMNNRDKGSTGEADSRSGLIPGQ